MTPAAPVLIDTSWWIDFFRGRLAPEQRQLTVRLLREDRVRLCPMVWLELYVGFRSTSEQSTLQQLRTACPTVASPPDLFQQAETLADLLRRHGLVLRAADLLVLAEARAARATLLHRDADFEPVLRLPEFAEITDRPPDPHRPTSSAASPESLNKPILDPTDHH